jgi:tetrathionate reductase subunit B
MEESIAKHGFVVKCHGCYHRVEKGLKPACVEACVGGARMFGDLEDPSSNVRKLIDSLPAMRLKAHLGTEPMVFYIGLDEKAAELGRKAPGAVIVHEEG